MACKTLTADKFSHWFQCMPVYLHRVSWLLTTLLIYFFDVVRFRLTLSLWAALNLYTLYSLPTAAPVEGRSLSPCLWIPTRLVVFLNCLPRISMHHLSVSIPTSGDSFADKFPPANRPILENCRPSQAPRFHQCEGHSLYQIVPLTASCYPLR